MLKMSNEGRLLIPSTSEMYADLRSRGIDVEQWKSIALTGDKKELLLLFQCYKQTISSRKFNRDKHNQIVARKLDRYCENYNKKHNKKT